MENILVMIYKYLYNKFKIQRLNALQLKKSLMHLSRIMTTIDLEKKLLYLR